MNFARRTRSEVQQSLPRESRKVETSWKVTGKNLLELRFFRRDASNGESGEEVCQKFRVITNDTKNFTGDCLYMCLCQFLHPEWDPEDALLGHRMIREKIVSFLTADQTDLIVWKKYSQILKNNHEARIKEFKDYVPDVATKQGHVKVLKAYRRGMLSGGYFGTMAELLASTELFGFKTVVIQENVHEKSFAVYHVGPSSAEHHLYLLFTGRNDAGHFQILKKLDDVGEIPVGTYATTSKSKSHNAYLLSKCDLSRSQSKEGNAPRQSKRKIESVFPSQLDVKKTRNSDNQEDESNGTGTCVGPSYGIPRQELTKLEMCNLRTRFMEDYTKRKSGVSTDEEDDESACSDEGTSTNGSASTLVSSVGNPPLPADEQPDMCLSYMFLPPWIASPVQTVHSDIQIHVPDKDYVLVDIRRSAEVGLPLLSLKQGSFQLQANSTYSLKNISEKGVFVRVIYD